MTAVLLAAAVLAGMLVNNPAGIDVGHVVSFGDPCVADLNGDGQLDLVIDRHKAARWDVYAGHADGTFDPMAGAPGRKTDTHGCAHGDFDRDGRPDLVGIKGACQGTCLKTDDLWMQKPGGWQMRNWQLGPMSYDRNRAAAVVDLDGDGWLDLVTVASGSPTGSAHRIYFNRGGTPWQGFAQHRIAKASGDTTCVQPLDLNGDGWLDVVVCAKAGLSAAFGPAFSGLTNLGVGVVEAVRPGPDGGWLVVRRDRLELAGPDLAPVVSFPLVLGQDAATVDFAGDGTPEIVVVQATARRAPSDPAAHHVLELGVGGWVRVDVPQPAQGAGAHVSAVGRRALILNGGRDGVTGLWDRKGPRQLIGMP